MKIVVAPDSFGGALDSVGAAQAIGAGWSKVRPADAVVLKPMADGGEGTLRAIAAALGSTATYRRSPSVDPLGRPIEAEWLLLDGGRAAFIELASASGLALLRPEERDVRAATTRGTGLLIRAALDAGVERMTIGLGGSATNDGGAGLLAALGVRLLDADGGELPAGGAALARLARVDASALDQRLAQVGLVIASDVENPLCGADGATAIYGPQKGADAAAVVELDAALARFASLAESETGRRVAAQPGAGAAGGAAFGLLCLTGATIRPGAEVVGELVALPEALADADLAITGEGRADEQTLYGKAAAWVASVASSRGCSVVLLCGAIGRGGERLEAEGRFALVQPITEGPMSVAESMAATPRLLAAAASRLARALDVGMRLGTAALLESPGRIAPK